MLALLDTPLPVRPALGRRDKALIKMAELQRKGPRYLLEWGRDRLAWERSKRTIKAAAPVEAQFNNTKIEAAFLRAVSRYQTPNWQGQMILLRPALDRQYKVSDGNWISAAREYVFADNDWTRFAPHVRVIEVPGDHDSMVLSPNVVVLAAELREAIADALVQEDTAPQATAAE